MAVTSFEAGAVFEIIDKASATIAKISKSVSTLDDTVESTRLNLAKLGTLKPFSKLDAQLDRLTKRFADLDASIGSSVAGMTTSTDTATASVRALAESWRAVQASANLAGTATMRATRAPRAALGVGGAGGGGRGNGISFAGPAMRLPGGGHAHFHGGISAQIGLAGIAYGGYEAASLSESIAAIELAAGKRISMDTALAKSIRDAIKSGMVETGLSPLELAGSAKNLFLQMGGVPTAERTKVLPDVFRFAAIEGILKGVSAKESTQSLVGLLHMSGAYTPQQIQKLAGSLAFASAISPVGLPGIERAASYSLPIAKNIMGLDPAMMLLVTAQLQSSGLLAGKGGTWLASALQSLAPKGNFASLLTSKGERNRLSGLKQLGLVDAQGHLSGLKMLEKNDGLDSLKR